MLVEVTKEKVAVTQGGHINAGELNVNTCAFSLPECFEGLNVTACFNGIPVPIVKNSCTIPALKQGTATLGVYAYKESEDGIELIYSPEPTCFCVHNGSFTEDFEQELSFEISEYEQYCNMLRGEYEEIEALFSQAEAERNAAESERQATFDGYKTYIDDTIGIKEDKSNKVSEVNGNSTHTHYPTAKAVYDYVTKNVIVGYDPEMDFSADTVFSTEAVFSIVELINLILNGLAEEKESKSNRATVIDETSTNEQYASAKAVYDYIQSVLPPSAEEVEY